jgi:glycogen debranching enzyme
MKEGEVRFGLFARDLFTTAFMLDDLRLLKDTIQFALITQGRKCDPNTGEEPYRVIHEYSDVEYRDLSTRYNAADTTLYLLIALECYHRQTQDRELIEVHSRRISSTIDYVLSRIEDDLFWEDPKRCGAERYALRATYWKDSGLPGGREPRYPVVYTLVQAQAACALRAAARLIRDFDLGYDAESLEERAERLIRALLSELWDDEGDFPIIALTNEGPVRGIASDGLHMLAYLRPGDLPSDKLRALAEGAAALQTPYGYRTYAPDQPGYDPKSYHWGSIWPFDQYFIACGAIKHGLAEIAKRSLGVVEALERFGFAELFFWDGRSLSPSGCGTLLWSTAYPKSIRTLIWRCTRHTWQQS